MSIEAMPSTPAMGVATAVSTGPALPSFGEEFSAGINVPQSQGLAPDLGGTNVPGFDQGALFETFNMPSPDSFPGDRNIPGTSPFENTKALWQAPSIPNETNTPIVPEDASTYLDNFKSEMPDTIPQFIDNAIPSLVSEPEVKLSEIINEPHLQNDKVRITAEHSISDISLPYIDAQLNSDLKVENIIQEASLKSESIISSEAIVNPGIKVDEKVMPESQLQEVIADARQAIRVEQALIAVGKPEKEAHKTAIEILRQTQEKKSMTSTPTDEKIKQKLSIQDKNIIPDDEKSVEVYFVHDEKADEARKIAVVNAVNKVIEEGAVPTGKSIVENLPSPEPPAVKSEIAKNTDGSYSKFADGLKSIDVSSNAEAGKAIDELVNANHAVKISKSPSALATESEVNKVLNGEEVTIFEE